jgi:UDP-GlcNAc3NAcA epimerase
MKILTIIGARPQIIKAAALSRAIKKHFIASIQEVIVHTGQHYDTNMSQVFFDEMGIPEPNYNLEVGSASHGVQTAQMISGIEEILEIEKPDYIILYGDTNSTLAGVIAASKIHIPIVHIEAGLRSFNKRMPEEVNRILCDHVSTFLFTPTKTGYQNLLNEGFKENEGPFTVDKPGIFHCGDVMYDNSLFFADMAEEKTNILSELDVLNKHFILATIHRDHNTDNPLRLQDIFEALLEIALEKKIKVVLPLHPRTKKKMETLPSELNERVKANTNIQIIQPVSFLEMIALEKNAQLIITDSGGVQKEAYYFHKPCIILRPETEWVEIIEAGTGILVNASKEKIKEAVNSLLYQTFEFPSIYGDGHAAEFICQKLLDNQKKQS